MLVSVRLEADLEAVGRGDVQSSGQRLCNGAAQLVRAHQKLLHLHLISSFRLCVRVSLSALWPECALRLLGVRHLPADCPARPAHAATGP